MNSKVWLTTVGLFAGIVGCAGGNAREGGGLPAVDPETMRRVQLQIEVTESVPRDATPISEVGASRGHRNAFNREPTEDDVLLDLKCAAYALGGDGIAQVHVEKKSGLMNNYWSVLEGKAIAWRRGGAPGRR
jgi:hypothetical protein